VASADWELAMRMAHTLKGVAGSIGADPLQQACHVLEAQAKEQQVERAARDLAAAEMSRVLQALVAVSDVEAGPAQTETSGADASVILAELIQQLENFDTSALATVEQHRQLLSTGPAADLFKSLEIALGEFDMLEAKGIAEKMLDPD
jgi:two-component system sensor histidine kinase/response regulator